MRWSHDCICHYNGRTAECSAISAIPLVHCASYFAGDSSLNTKPVVNRLIFEVTAHIFRV